MSSTERTFEVLGANFAAKHWPNAEGYPTLALHGWLDNANTFDLLAPALPELNIVGLDFAGHGRSDHRPPGVHYPSLLDVPDVLAVADSLGWTTATSQSTESVSECGNDGRSRHPGHRPEP